MINSRIIASGIVRSVFIIIGFLLLLFFIYKIQTVIVYLIIALVLTLIGNPIQKFFRVRFKFNNTFASIATMIVFISIIVGFILMFVPLILTQSESLSLLNTGEIEKSIKLLINQSSVFLENHHINSKNIFNQKDLSSKIDFNFIPNFLNVILGTISSFGIGMASVLFITFFFLKDKILFVIGIKKILPDNQEEKILNSLEKTNSMLSRYFIGLLIQLFIVFIMYLVVLLIFGINDAFIIAFLCGILNIIPYVGPIIGAFFAAILSMIGNLNGDFQSETLPTSIYVFMGFIAIHLIDANISQPIIFSKSVKSHPLEIFLVVLISGFLFGILGMVIAIPFYTILKVFAKEFLPENKIIQEITKNI
jgi:predicted PurR-regulated permease PerM